MAESYSVEAVLSAVDKGFTDTMKGADKTMGGFEDKTKKSNNTILDVAKGIGVFKLVDGAVNMVTGSLGGAINRFDTLNKYPTVMQALGYSAQDVDKSMGKLTDGIDGLPTKLDDIVANTQQLAISTGSLDKGTDTAIALNNAFLASGASSADASRGMEQYRQMLGRGEVDMQSFKSVQETMPIAMDKVAKSFEDRGVGSVNELYDALKNGDVTFTEFNDKLIELNDGVGGFADLAKKNSKGIQTSFENIKSAVTKGVEKTIRAIDEGLANAGLGGIADMLDKVKDGVNKTFGILNAVIPPAIGFLADLYKMIEPYIPLISVIVGYIATYQAVMLTAEKATKAWKWATEGATIAQKLLNAVMSLNPIGIIVTAVIVLVGVIIYLWKTNEDFRNAVIKIWEGIKNKFDEVSKAVVKYWEATKKWFSEFWEWLKQVPQNTLDYIKQKWETITTFFSDLWTKVKTKTSEIWEGIKEIFSPYVESILSIFEPMIEWFGTLWETVKTITGAAWEIIKSVIMAPVLFIIDLITGNFTQLKEDMSMIWTNIKEQASIIWEALKQYFFKTIEAIVQTAINLWNSFLDGVVMIWESIVKIGKDIWNLFKNWLIETITKIVNEAKDKWENLKKGTVDTFNKLVDGAKQAWEDLKKSVRDVVDKVKNIFDTIKDINLWEAGKAILDSLLEGLKKSWKNVQDFVGGIGGWIRDHKGPIQYDRKLLIPAGGAIMAGLDKGLNKGFGKVKDNVNDMTRYFANTAFDQDFEIGTNFSDLDRKIGSMNDMNLSSNNELTLKNSTQPAEIKLNIGGRVFSAFVEDIGAVMQAETDLNLQT